MPAGKSLTIVAGRFEAYGRRPISADAGRIQIGAVGSAAIDVRANDIAASAGWTSAGLGDVVIRDDTQLETENTLDPTGPQGHIVIRGGRFELANGALLRAYGEGPQGPPAVDVAVTGGIDIHDRGMILQATNLAPTGDVVLDAVQIRIRNGGAIDASVRDGDGGAIRLRGRVVDVADGGYVTSFSTGPADAGDIDI